MKFAVSAAIALLVCLPCIARAAPPRADARTQLSSIERETAKIRQLTPRGAVAAYFPSSSAFDAALSATMRRDNPDSEIVLNQKELVLLGLLRPQDNLRSLLLHNFGAQVVGFYDPRRKVLYVRNDSNAVFGAERSTIAHEYTHALQDQHFHLLKLTPDLTGVKYRNSDAPAAHHALTEGDAVTTQTLFIVKTYSRQDLRALGRILAQQSQGPSLPKALQREFDFPYTVGTQFVQTLYKLGGMRQVNQAYARLPSSTYEIMHPSAYLHHWKPVSVRLHAARGFDSWQTLDDDVFGALAYELLLWQYLPKKTADSVTNAYRGDRYLFLERGAQHAMLMQSVWTSHGAALAARSALLQALRKRYPGGRIASSIGTSITSPTLSAYVRAAGSRVTLTYAPTTALAVQLGRAPTR